MIGDTFEDGATWRDGSLTLRNMERVHDLRILLRTLEERNRRRDKKNEFDDATVLDNAAYILLVKKEIERIERRALHAEMSQRLMVHPLPIKLSRNR